MVHGISTHSPFPVLSYEFGCPAFHGLRFRPIKKTATGQKVLDILYKVQPQLHRGWDSL